MKFLVPNYSCFQIKGLPPPDPRSLSSTEFVKPTAPRPREKFLGTPLVPCNIFQLCMHHDYSKTSLHIYKVKFTLGHASPERE